MDFFKEWISCRETYLYILSIYFVYIVLQQLYLFYHPSLFKNYLFTKGFREAEASSSWTRSKVLYLPNKKEMPYKNTEIYPK